MWFGPLERNTLRPWENGVVLLKPSLVHVSLSPCFFLTLLPAASSYRSRPQQLHCDLGLDRLSRGDLTPIL
jgi:hypothetical protein